jgi:hypothetical protein
LPKPPHSKKVHLASFAWKNVNFRAKNGPARQFTFAVPVPCIFVDICYVQHIASLQQKGLASPESPLFGIGLSWLTSDHVSAALQIAVVSTRKVSASLLPGTQLERTLIWLFSWEKC